MHRYGAFVALLALVALGTLAASVAGADPAGPERIIVLAADTVDTHIIGRQDKDQLGNDMRAGDLNGDGIPDLILGAHWGSVGGRNIQGRAYVMFGGPGWPARVDLAQSRAPDWSFMGTAFEARLGSAVGAGDLSGDGVDDLVLGSVLADPYGQANGGAVYLMFGGPAVGGHVDFLNAQPDAFLVGASYAGGEPDRLGTDLVTGDFNGDGHVDLAVAAAFRSGFRGAVFVWWGPFARGSVRNLQQQPADWTLVGPATNAFFGAALAAGDVNGDGVADLVVSAYKAEAASSGDQGAVHVFLGGSGRGGLTDLASEAADLTVVGPPGAYLGAALSPGSCSCRGQPLALADLTGNGHLDLVAGAPLAEGRRGGAFLVPGPLEPGRVDLAERPHLYLRGTMPEGRLGWSLATGSLDTDSQADLVLAAPWASPDNRANAGAFLGLRGPLPPNGQLDLTENNVTLLARSPEGGAGNGGASLLLADTNGDGLGDLHISLPDSAPLGRRSVGAVFVLRGPLLAAPPTATPSASLTATSLPSETSPPPTTPPSEPPPSATATDPDPGATTLTPVGPAESATPAGTTAVPSPSPTATATTSPSPTHTPATPTVLTPTLSPTTPSQLMLLWLPFAQKPRPVYTPRMTGDAR